MFIPSAAFCLTYAALLPVVHRRPGCTGAHARLREAVVWGSLSFAVVHAATSLAIVCVGLRGKRGPGFDAAAAATQLSGWVPLPPSVHDACSGMLSWTTTAIPSYTCCPAARRRSI